MTDKQIIIDGVDVSSCSDFSESDECNNFNVNLSMKCSLNSNCFFKQLKRDEQRIVELNKTIKAKEQECERLKESLKVWKYSDVQHIFKINKYKQTLTEIKEIAEKSVKTEDYLLGMEFTELVDNILQKISECEVENAR